VVVSASVLVVVEKFENCGSGKTSAIDMLKTATIKKIVKKNTLARIIECAYSKASFFDVKVKTRP
jgi:hypothetical protein